MRQRVARLALVGRTRAPLAPPARELRPALLDAKRPNDMNVPIAVSREPTEGGSGTAGCNGFVFPLLSLSSEGAVTLRLKSHAEVSMKRIGLWCLLLSTLLVWQAPRTNAQVAPQNGTNVGKTGQLVLYDDFRGPRIDPDKWDGIWGDFSDMREMVRETTTQPWTRARSLHVFARSYAFEWGVGGPFSLVFTNSDRLTEIAATVTVRAAEAISCPDSGGFTAAVAELRGQFFNTELTPPGGSEGDVQVALTINRFATDADNAMEVSGFYNRCDDQYCASQSNLGGGSLGYIYPGQPARLRVKWDQPNHRFIFQLNRQPAFISPYTVSDTTPAQFPPKWIGITRILPGCTTAPRPTAMMDAYFSDVYVNAQ
jgi:hypothetical protein